MAIDERARHELYLRLEEHLGPEAASTLMEHLPPTGWAEVTTKRDLDHLREVTKADIDRYTAEMRSDIDRYTAEMRSDIELLGTQLRLEMRDMSLALQKKISSQTWVLLSALLLAVLGALISGGGR